MVKNYQKRNCIKFTDKYFLLQKCHIKVKKQEKIISVVKRVERLKWLISKIFTIIFCK